MAAPVRRDADIVRSGLIHRLSAEDSRGQQRAQFFRRLGFGFQCLDQCGLQRLLIFERVGRSFQIRGRLFAARAVEPAILLVLRCLLQIREIFGAKQIEYSPVIILA